MISNGEKAPDYNLERLLSGKVLHFAVLLGSEGKVADLNQGEPFPTTLLIGKNEEVQVMHACQLMKGTLPGTLAKLGLP